MTEPSFKPRYDGLYVVFLYLAVLYLVWPLRSLIFSEGKSRLVNLGEREVGEGCGWDILYEKRINKKKEWKIISNMC